MKRYKIRTHIYYIISRNHFFATYLKAKFWSNNPALPGASGVPKNRNPNDATLYCIDITMTFSSAASILEDIIFDMRTKRE